MDRADGRFLGEDHDYPSSRDKQPDLEIMEIWVTGHGILLAGNRQKIGFDANLPTSWLLVWHRRQSNDQAA
jgi:hypothetical protein